MKKRIFSLFILLCGVLFFGSVQSAYAVGPYTPLADTYTLLNDPNIIAGSELYLFLSASNLAGCVPTSYVWLKFQVPNPSATIATAILSVPIDPVYPGDEPLDMELRSSSDTTWQEASLNWANQPTLDPTVLATASSTVAPSDALFMGPTFADYLNSRKGQLVSLVVKANCNGNVSVSADRVIPARENTTWHKVELDLRSPSNVGLLDMKGSTGTQPGQIVILGILVGLSLAFAVGKKSY